MTYDVVIFGIHLTLNPVAFTLPIGANGWNIYWYGVIIALGFCLAIFYGTRNSERLGINPDKMIDVVLIVTPIAVLCARTYYVLFDGVKCESIGDFFGFSSSSGVAGIAIPGGIIGAFTSAVIVCKIFKMKFTDMFDLAALGFLIGQGVGRWGNFINQEAYGGFTGSDFWGMQSQKTVLEMGEGLVHPCFLYESIWCILGFVIIHNLSKKRKFSGEVFLMYCAWYGFGRGCIEILRTDSLMLGGVKISCLLCFVACAVSVALITYIRKKIKESSVEYTAVFSENLENEND